MPYLSPGDYGLIGNQTSAALISRLGSIDWCCFPRLDSSSHFATLLDDTQGGRFSITPSGDFHSEQHYRQRTHVLETTFETPHGRAVLTDWMPMDETECGAPVIYRRVEVIDGKISWLLNCLPKFNYGRDPGRAEYHHDGILFRGPDPWEVAELQSTVPLEISQNGAGVLTRFTLEAGKDASFVWRWGASNSLHPKNPSQLSPKSTVDFWQKWAHRCIPAGCGLAGPWHDATTRSALVLKLLMNSETGTIAESVTTSVPAIEGEARTWDYRFSWIRDSAATIQALANMGYHDECHTFFGWLSDVIIRDGADGLQPVYRLDEGRVLPEIEIEHLAGHLNTRPVRVGNHSSSIFQLDIYGHAILAANQYFRIFGKLPHRLWPKISDLAEYVCQAWRRPDQGPWELRSKPQHYVITKVYCWAAIDRAIDLARALDQPVPSRWQHEREVLHRLICQQGYDSNRGYFTRAFSDPEVDAANLMIPLLGFLPPDDPRVIGTLDAIQAELSDGVLLRRYQGDDGLGSRDSRHLSTSFWFAAALAFCGRADEASDRLAELCSYSTPLGFFAEQVDPTTEETTGNFPSASTHISLINAALYVGAARGRQLLTGHLMGWPEPTAQARSA